MTYRPDPNLPFTTLSTEEATGILRVSSETGGIDHDQQTPARGRGLLSINKVPVNRGPTAMTGGMTYRPDPNLPFTTLSTEEAASILRVSPETICDYIRRELLTASRVGRRWLINQQSVRRLLETGTHR